jgi:hypothetical protein
LVFDRWEFALARLRKSRKDIAKKEKEKKEEKKRNGRFSGNVEEGERLINSTRSSGDGYL